MSKGFDTSPSLLLAQYCILCPNATTEKEYDQIDSRTPRMRCFRAAALVHAYCTR